MDVRITLILRNWARSSRGIIVTTASHIRLSTDDNVVANNNNNDDAEDVSCNLPTEQWVSMLEHTLRTTW